MEGELKFARVRKYRRGINGEDSGNKRPRRSSGIKEAAVSSLELKFSYFIHRFIVSTPRVEPITIDEFLLNIISMVRRSLLKAKLQIENERKTKMETWSMMKIAQPFTVVNRQVICSPYL